MNSILYEAWMSCSGNWTNSRFLLQIRQRTSDKIKGVRKWFTRSELIAKFGEGPAEDIISRKAGDEQLAAKEIRQHPECPDNQDMQTMIMISYQSTDVPNIDIHACTWLNLKFDGCHNHDHFCVLGGGGGGGERGCSAVCVLFVPTALFSGSCAVLGSR